LCRVSRFLPSLSGSSLIKNQIATFVSTARLSSNYNDRTTTNREMKDHEFQRETKDNRNDNKWTEEKWAEFKRQHFRGGDQTMIPPWMSSNHNGTTMPFNSMPPMVPFAGPFGPPPPSPFPFANPMGVEPMGGYGYGSYGVPFMSHPSFGLAGPWAEAVTTSTPSWAWSHQQGGMGHLMMNRGDVTMLLLCAKKSKGITFADIAKMIKCNEVFTTAAILGQHSLQRVEAETICECLGLDKKLKTKVVTILMEPPLRGLPIEYTRNGGIPLDPTIYRWYEIMQVYGTTFKTLLNEKFGYDGVMSSVNMTMEIEKEGKDKDGRDRVKVTIKAPYESFDTVKKME